MPSELRIDSVEAWALRVPLESPIDFGRFIVRERDYVALRIRTDHGLVADCLAQSRGSPIDIVLTDLIAPIVLGNSASELEARGLDVRRALTALEVDGAIGRAWSVMEICLQDLRAQAAGLPLWKFLGGSPRTVTVQLVEGYALVGETDSQFAERLAARVTEGFRSLKIEAAHYSDRAEIVRRVALLRDLVGPSCKIVLDFAWTLSNVSETCELLSALQDLQIAWIEDPFPREQVSQYQALKRVSKIPIGCGDESSRPADIDALMNADAIDVVRLDATTIGGIGAAETLSRSARSRGLRVSFHERPEVHEHCVFGFDSADHLEIFPVDRPFDCAHRLLLEPVAERIKEGALAARSAVGTGIRFVEGSLSKWARRHSKVSGQGVL